MSCLDWIFLHIWTGKGHSNGYFPTKVVKSSRVHTHFPATPHRSVIDQMCPVTVLIKVASWKTCYYHAVAFSRYSTLKKTAMCEKHHEIIHQIKFLSTSIGQWRTGGEKGEIHAADVQNKKEVLARWQNVKTDKTEWKGGEISQNNEASFRNIFNKKTHFPQLDKEADCGFYLSICPWSMPCFWDSHCFLK